MILRKTVSSFRGTYRLFEADQAVYHVLDEDGRTVDQFDLVLAESVTGATKNKAFRRRPLARGIPDLARSIVSEINRLRRPG